MKGLSGKGGQLAFVGVAAAGLFFIAGNDSQVSDSGACKDQLGISTAESVKQIAQGDDTPYMRCVNQREGERLLNK